MREPERKVGCCDFYVFYPSSQNCSICWYETETVVTMSLETSHGKVNSNICLKCLKCLKRLAAGADSAVEKVLRRAKRREMADEKRDQRKIQDVLQLHVISSESAREMFVRVGTSEQELYQAGVTAGLRRAIEVAINIQQQNSVVDAMMEPGIIRR